MATDIKLRSVVNENSLKASSVYTPRSTVYVEDTNTLGPLEDVMDGTDNQFSINNTAWGSTGVVRIPPSYPLVKAVMLNVELAYSADPTQSQPGHGPDCSYWIYRLIRNFTYRLGNSDKVVESGDHLPFLVNEMCDTQEKREALLAAAGESFQLVTDRVARSGTINLQGIMPMPWSSPSTFNGPKPVPLYMTNQSLELEIEWEQFTNVKNLIYCGTTAALSINKASYKIIYEQLGSHNQLKAAPYLYPFQYHQSQTYPVALTLDSSKTCDYMAVPQAVQNSYNPLSCTFTMLGLRSGETSQFMFRLAPREKVFVGTASSSIAVDTTTTVAWAQTGLTTKCNDIYAGVKLSCIEVEFGGQRIYSADTSNSTELIESFYNFLPPRLPGRKRGITPGAFLRGPPAGCVTYPLGVGGTNYLVYGAPVGAGDDGYGTYLPDVATATVRAQPILREPHDLINRFRSINNNNSGNRSNHYSIRGDEPAGFYYHIPVAQLLDHVRGQNYSLGADFEKGELKVKCVVDTDYYRRKGQFPLVPATGTLAATIGATEDGSNVCWGRAANWTGELDPDCAMHWDVVDGFKWIKATQGQGQNTDYAIYALASTNAIYHFSGQNVTRVS